MPANYKIVIRYIFEFVCVCGSQQKMNFIFIYQTNLPIIILSMIIWNTLSATINNNQYETLNVSLICPYFAKNIENYISIVPLFFDFTYFIGMEIY